MENEQKYWYKVGLYAEGQTTGWVRLTEKQAEIIAFTSNSNNWILVDDESYSGSFGIDLSSKRKTRP